MNRVKIWVFTVVVVAVGFALLRAATVARRAEATEALDARLASAAAHFSASTRSMGREASAAAGFVARDPRLAASLNAQAAAAPAPRARRGKPAAPPPEGEADEAKVSDGARQALAAAERQFGFDLPGSTVVSAGNREWLARKGEPGAGETDAVALLRAAIGGQPRRAFVRMNGAVWHGASAPAGEGAGVAVFLPLDEAWARALATGAGADVTIVAPDVKPISTANPSDVPALQQATKHVAGAGEVGSAGKVDVSLGPVRLPRLPQPVAGGAPLRARAIPIEGLKNGFAIVSIRAAAALDPPAASFWRALLVLALVLAAGIVLGFLVPSADGPPAVPEALHAAAARIESGDFAARAPQLAGKLGTVAAALNRAAEIAGPAQAARNAPPAPSVSAEWFQGPAPGAPAAETTPPAAPGTPAAEAAPPAAQAAAAPPGVEPGPALEADEETHWQQVFQDFLRTRASCGEPSEGLTYDKFRQKLEGNKAQLAAKYACKTVRFQVYVKDGKAALKATPVR